MGNAVRCASNEAGHIDSSVKTVEPTPSKTTSDGLQEGQNATRTAESNPGAMDELHKKCKGMKNSAAVSISVILFFFNYRGFSHLF